MPNAHFKFWPSHAMHNLIAPATNLFYNAEVSARRYPEQAVPGFLRHAGELRRVSRRSGTRRRDFSSRRCGGSQGRSGAAAHAEQPAVHDRLLRHPARQRGGRAVESDESDAGNPALRQGCRRDHDAGVAGAVSARRTAAQERRSQTCDRRGVFGLSERADDAGRAGFHRRAAHRLQGAGADAVEGCAGGQS